MAAAAAGLLAILGANVADAADASSYARADSERSDRPAGHSQVVVGLLAHDCSAGAPPVGSEIAGQPGPAPTSGEAGRVAVGSCVTMRIASEVAGRITVFSRSADGEMTQIFPNKHSGGLFRAPTRIGARQAIAIPGPSDEFELKVVASPEPGSGGHTGRSEIVAVVAPEAAALERVAMRPEGRRLIDSDENVRVVPVLLASEGCR